jgi:hydrogenase/urease accessory protein HupE
LIICYFCCAWSSRSARITSLIPVIAAFTLGHSVTLVGIACGLAPPDRWFPPFVEMAIAVSIVYMALENIVNVIRRRWIIAGLFGLVHGFGFADVLSQQLQFAGSNLLISLFSFNLAYRLAGCSFSAHSFRLSPCFSAAPGGPHGNHRSVRTRCALRPGTG